MYLSSKKYYVSTIWQAYCISYFHKQSEHERLKSNTISFENILKRSISLWNLHKMYAVHMIHRVPFTGAVHWVAVSAELSPSWSVVNLSEISSGRKWWGEGEQEIELLSAAAWQDSLFQGSPESAHVSKTLARLKWLCLECLRPCARPCSVFTQRHTCGEPFQTFDEKWLILIQFWKCNTFLAAVESIVDFPQDWTLKASFTHSLSPSLKLNETEKSIVDQLLVC